MNKVLLKIKGFSEIKADKVKDAAKKCMVRILMDKYSAHLMLTDTDSPAAADS